MAARGVPALTAEQANEIRLAYARGNGALQRELAERYGVTQATISNVCNRRAAYEYDPPRDGRAERREEHGVDLELTRDLLAAGLSPGEVAERLSIARPTVYRRLQKLRERGMYPAGRMKAHR